MVVGLGAVENKAILKTRKLAGDTDVVPVSVISRLSIFVVKKKKKAKGLSFQVLVVRETKRGMRG